MMKLDGILKSVIDYHSGQNSREYKDYRRGELTVFPRLPARLPS